MSLCCRAAAHALPRAAAFCPAFRCCTARGPSCPFPPPHHRLLDPAADAAGATDVPRAGGAELLPPLVAAELRRQVGVLELLAGHGAVGLRPALEVSTEGRRVLRAVVSRRARGRR
ncbi:hypothetical protein SVIOM342S_07021 [Streptomyces violaceorubidus]